MKMMLLFRPCCYLSSTLRLRPTSWSIPYNVIYIDQPAGTGFSFTGDDSGYVTDQDGVARDLYQAMKQFYTMFPELLKNDLYITGESYAGKLEYYKKVTSIRWAFSPGKYVPAISYKIHQENLSGSKPKMPLKGLAIGDGLCDPINQLDYGEFLFQTGLLDEGDSRTADIIAALGKEAIEKKQWAEAVEVRKRALLTLQNFFFARIYISPSISEIRPGQRPFREEDLPELHLQLPPLAPA